MDINEVKKLICEQRLTEVSDSGIELKASWDQSVGKEISSLANDLSTETKWVIIGVSDTGVLTAKGVGWAQKEEQLISNHLHQYLSPTWAANVHPSEKYIIIEVKNPGDIVYWNSKPYKRVGTQKYEILSREEEISLSKQLPGLDYSKQTYQTEIQGSLVVKFAELVNSRIEDEQDKLDVDNSSPQDILSQLGILHTQTAAILFGKNYVARILRYNEQGDILSQEEKKGLFSILDQSFISDIQNWTRKNAAQIAGESAVMTEELPYPKFALRESIANAVAHANYSYQGGGIIVELHPGRLVIRNNSLKESSVFMNRWFSRDSHVVNKLLMVTLRKPKIADEAGNGKHKIFRAFIEESKFPPTVEIQSLNTTNNKVSIFLYSTSSNEGLLGLTAKIKILFAKSDERKFVLAAILWHQESWTDILEKCDAHFKLIAHQVISDKNCPFYVYGEKLVLKHWAWVMLTGKDQSGLTDEQEATWLQVLSGIVKSRNSDHLTEFSIIREIIGLESTASDNAKLTHLLKKWSADGFVEKSRRRGYWKFL